MKAPIVLLGFAEALAACETVWSLCDAGYRVVVFARRGIGCGLRYSRRVRCRDVTRPEEDVGACMSEIAGIVSECAEESGPAGVLILPLDDAALWICNRLNLDSSVMRAGPNGKSGDMALNKWVQLEVASEVGLQAPESRVIEGAEELLKRRWAYPIILKPSLAIGCNDGRLRKTRKWVCNDDEELQRAAIEWRKRTPLLVQPFLQGVGEGVFGLYDRGEVTAWSAHRRVRMMNPHGSGSSACVSLPVPEELKSGMVAFLGATSWQGLFMFEWLCDPSGRRWFVEFNGRPWGSMALARRLGLEYPQWAADMVMGRERTMPTITRGAECRVCRHLGREIAHLLFVARGPQSKAFTAWPSFWGSLWNVACIRPGDRFYNWRNDDKKVFLADTWYTIRNQVFKP